MHGSPSRDSTRERTSSNNPIVSFCPCFVPFVHKMSFSSSVVGSHHCANPCSLNASIDEYKTAKGTEIRKTWLALIIKHRKLSFVFTEIKLRNVPLEYLQWISAMKKDYTSQKVMETQKHLNDTDGFNWLESTKLAIDKREFLLNRLFVKQPIPQDED